VGKRVAMKLKREKNFKKFGRTSCFCWGIAYNELKLIFITLSQLPNAPRFSLFQAGRNLVHLKKKKNLKIYIKKNHHD
jgi:hypothetical protein